MTEDEELTFACRCSPESIAEVEAVWAWAASLNKHNTDPMKTLDYALYKLSDWGATFQIPSDQWAGVSASNSDWTGEYAPPHFSSFVQCDDITDGFMYTFKLWHDHYEGKNSRKLREEGKDADVDHPGDQV